MVTAHNGRGGTPLYDPAHAFFYRRETVFAVTVEHIRIPEVHNFDGGGQKTGILLRVVEAGLTSGIGSGYVSDGPGCQSLASVPGCALVIWHAQDRYIGVQGVHVGTDRIFGKGTDSCNG